MNIKWTNRKWLFLVATAVFFLMLSGKNAVSDVYAAVPSVEERIIDMESAVFTYYSATDGYDAYLDSGEKFWRSVQIYAKYDLDFAGQLSVPGTEAIPEERIRYLGYVLFADFNGALPAIPQNMLDSGDIEKSKDGYYFKRWSSEGRELRLENYEVRNDQSVFVQYTLSAFQVDTGMKDIAKIIVTYVPNTNIDPVYPLCYTVSSFSVDHYPAEEVLSKDSGYIFPHSGSMYLDPDALLFLDAETLRLARNEIYARRGRLFDSEKLQSYFDSQPWYYGFIFPDEFDENAIFNKFEKENIKVIAAEEKKR